MKKSIKEIFLTTNLIFVSAITYLFFFADRERLLKTIDMKALLLSLLVGGVATFFLYSVYFLAKKGIKDGRKEIEESMTESIATVQADVKKLKRNQESNTITKTILLELIKDCPEDMKIKLASAIHKSHAIFNEREWGLPEDIVIIIEKQNIEGLIKHIESKKAE